MNFLFALAVGSAFAIQAYVILMGVSIIAKVVIPRKVRWGVPALVFLFATYSAAQTYGPRIELSGSQGIPAPERVEVPSGKEFVSPEDRNNVFSDRLEVEKVEEK